MAFSPTLHPQHLLHFTHRTPVPSATHPAWGKQSSGGLECQGWPRRLTWEKLKTIPSKSNHLFHGTHFQIRQISGCKETKIPWARRTILSFYLSCFTTFLWTTQWSELIHIKGSLPNLNANSTWELGGYYDTGDCPELESLGIYPNLATI